MNVLVDLSFLRAFEAVKVIMIVNIVFGYILSALTPLGAAGIPLGVLGKLLHKLPLYSMGFCWVCFAAGALVISIVLNLIPAKKNG